MERAPIVACRVEARDGGASRALVAAERLRAGQVALEESPLLLVPHGEGGADVSYPLVQLRAFKQQDSETRARILELHSPTDGPRASGLREQLRRASGSAGNLLSDEDLELWLKVAMVFHYNAVDVSPASTDGSAGRSLGAGLFATACRANHSCRPNCFWYAAADGSRVLRALGPVAEGEELTIDYALETMDTRPVHERRAHLQGWDFLCGCPRCSAYGDDTRTLLPCSASSTSSPSSSSSGSASCPGVHLVHQPSSDAPAVLTPCNACGAPAPEASAAQALQQEASTARKIQEIAAALEDASSSSSSSSTSGGARAGRGEGSVGSLLEAAQILRAPHPSHYLAAELNWTLYELHGRVTGDPEAAAACLERVVLCRDAIVSFPSRATAFRLEFLGDLLLQGPPGVTAPARLASAQEAYRGACRSLLVTSGPSHPFSICVTRKLAALQCRLPPGVDSPLGASSADGTPGTFCSMCGAHEAVWGGGASAGAAAGGGGLPKCGRCKSVAYCCPEHQKAHWKVHKRSCVAATPRPPPPS